MALLTDNSIITTGHFGQMNQEPFQNRRPRQKWGIKALRPYQKKYQQLLQTVKTSEEEVKRYEAALRAADPEQLTNIEIALEAAKSARQEAQTRLTEFINSVPFPSRKL